MKSYTSLLMNRLYISHVFQFLLFKHLIMNLKFQDNKNLRISESLIMFKAPKMNKLLIYRWWKHMFLPFCRRNDLISAIYESNLEDKELQNSLNNYQARYQNLFPSRNFKSLVDISKYEIYFISNSISEEYPVQKANVKWTQKNTENVYGYRVSVKAQYLDDCTFNTYQINRN